MVLLLLIINYVATIPCPLRCYAKTRELDFLLLLFLVKHVIRLLLRCMFNNNVYYYSILFIFIHKAYVFAIIQVVNYVYKHQLATGLVVSDLHISLIYKKLLRSLLYTYVKILS